jgi:hypothetical protein
MILSFNVLVEADVESVPHIKGLILGVLRIVGTAKVLFEGEGKQAWFEENERQAVERGELGAGL